MKISKRISVCFVVFALIASTFVTLGVHSFAGTSELDVVFMIDTTGSMSGLSSIAGNIKNFDTAIKNSGLSARYALVEFKDITDDGYDSTRVHKNGSSNWFTGIDTYKSKVNSLTLTGGGDNPETVIDALEMARRLDMRDSAAKLFVLITDYTYKTNNRYGISSMSEEVNLLKSSGITCAVVGDSEDKSSYSSLYSGTNGIWCTRGTDFYSSLVSLAKNIASSFDGTYIPSPIIPDYPESSHPYSNNYSNTWYYTHPGNITKMLVTFSANTYVEPNYDYIYIYNGSGSQVGKYTGSTLAGKTIEFNSGSFSVKLTSDGSNTGHGFSISKIEVTCSHSYTGYDSLEPTCTKEGVKVFVCSCGDRYESNVAKLAHKFTDYVENNDGTCMIKGTKTAYCDYKCGTSDTITGSLRPDNHSYTSKIIKNPTCSAKGEKRFTCACGDSYTVEIARLSHVFTKYVSNNDGKCGVQGTVTAYCDNGCGTSDTKSDPSTVDGHIREWVEVTKPTCISKGKQEYRCVNCKKVYSSVDIAVSPSAHNKVRNVITPATCQSTGREEEVCTLCKKSLGKYVIPKDPANHVMEWKINVKATCTEEGVKEGYCKECGLRLDSEKIPATGHNYVADVRREPTCSKVGKVVYTCHCGASFTENPDTVPHKYTNYVSNNDGTCVTNETKTAYCDYGCGKTDVKIVSEAKGHTYKMVDLSKATCTTDGKELYVCTCGDFYIKNIPAVGHNYVESAVRNATCTEPGEIVYTCSCGHSYNTLIEQIPHSFTVYTENNDGSCTTDSTVSAVCDYGCGEKNVKVVAVAKGHEFGSWMVIEPVTDYEDGLEIRICAVCEYIEERTIPNSYENKFVDVSDKHWFAEYVAYCVKKGYVSGVTETTFCPNNSLTREQFVLILANLDGVDLSQYANKELPFSDVKDGAWYENAVAWAYEKGYSSGVSDTKFGVGQKITREQLARFFFVYAEANGYDVSGRADLSGYTDAASVSSWALTPVQWAVDAGLISGMTETTILPRGNATRAQAARMFTVFDEFRNIK